MNKSTIARVVGASVAFVTILSAYHLISTKADGVILAVLGAIAAFWQVPATLNMPPSESTPVNVIYEPKSTERPDGE